LKKVKFILLELKFLYFGIIIVKVKKIEFMNKKKNIIEKPCQKVELLMPAGDMKKLKYALEYGADAVYIGWKKFSLRARANNFELDEIEQAVFYTHSLGKKIYVTVNSFIRDYEKESLENYLKFLYEINVDAIIVSDPGIIYLAKKEVPNLCIHLSTQANTTNNLSVKFWKEFGIVRIVLARELSIDEISSIVKNNFDMEFEIFVHGAMCISYSGRCFLSKYMIDRDANRGDCAHPCRWEYTLLEEKKRPNQFMKYEEDEKGSYIFNSSDMCQILRIKELLESGVHSFKIEGRMKSLYYIICTTNIYRKAIDIYYENPQRYEAEKLNFLAEIFKLNNRGYTEGFYFGAPTEKYYNYNENCGKITHYFLAEILEVIEKNKIKVLVKNSFSINDKVEILTPNNKNSNNIAIVKNIYSLKDNEFIEKSFCDLEAIIELENINNDNIKNEFDINEFSIIRAISSKN
jgi:putative protease